MNNKLYKALKEEMDFCAELEDCAEAEGMLLLKAIYREQNNILERILNRYVNSVKYQLEVCKGKATIIQRNAEIDLKDHE